MIAEKEKVSNFGLADLSPLGRKAVYRMSDIDPTVLQCINMSGLYRMIWNAAWMLQKSRQSAARTPRN